MTFLLHCTALPISLATTMGSSHSSFEKGVPVHLPGEALTPLSEGPYEPYFPRSQLPGGKKRASPWKLKKFPNPGLQPAPAGVEGGTLSLLPPTQSPNEGTGSSQVYIQATPVKTDAESRVSLPREPETPRKGKGEGSPGAKTDSHHGCLPLLPLPASYAVFI